MKEGYLAFLGSKTEEAIRSYYVDKVIFSCKALDHNWGIMESQEPFGTTKKAMVASAREKFLVIDSTKFDQTAFSVAGNLRDVDVVVTDIKPSEKWFFCHNSLIVFQSKVSIYQSKFRRKCTAPTAEGKAERIENRH